MTDRDGVSVSIIRCDGCGRLGVTIGDTRITGHKCGGRWSVVREELVARGVIAGALKEDAARRIREAGGG